MLLEWFLGQSYQISGRGRPRFGEAAMRCLLDYGWYAARFEITKPTETTLTVPWLSDRGSVFIDGQRLGTVGVCIGISGMPALIDERGWTDLFGYKLRATVVGAADELAAAASLMMGQAAEGTPAVHVRGFPYPLQSGSLHELLRPEADGEREREHDPAEQDAERDRDDARPEPRVLERDRPARRPGSAPPLFLRMPTSCPGLPLQSLRAAIDVRRRRRFKG